MGRVCSTAHTTDLHFRSRRKCLGSIHPSAIDRPQEPPETWEMVQWSMNGQDCNSTSIPALYCIATSIIVDRSPFIPFPHDTPPARMERSSAFPCEVHLSPALSGPAISWLVIKQEEGDVGRGRAFRHSPHLAVLDVQYKYSDRLVLLLLQEILVTAQQWRDQVPQHSYYRAVLYKP